uniref:hypothetical protein n=1 Tax=Salmonella sp. TaxID=599 RepID=UPI001CD99AB2|nr:hypothetical protein [Salmonella sp.]
MHDKWGEYLGSGETLEQMKIQNLIPKWGGIVSGSIADYVGGKRVVIINGTNKIPIKSHTDYAAAKLETICGDS